MKIKSQIIIAALAFTLCTAGLVGVYYYTENRIDMSAIEHIAGFQVAPNEFVDLANDIGVESSEDLGFLVKSDYNIIIYYGKQIIKMNPNCFASQEYRNALEEIGINVYTRESDDGTIEYMVTYWGEAIEQYTRVE